VINKTEVLDWVSEFTRGRADAAAIDKAYDDTLVRLGVGEWLVNVELLEVTAGTSQYTLPTTAARPVAFWYDDTELSAETRADLEAGVGASWRDHKGSPESVVFEDENDRTFRLYPAPDIVSKPFSFITGLPMGTDFPSYAVAVMFTERPLALPEWLKLPLGLLVTAREFSRESRHRDPAFAEACQETAERLLTLLV
jgi:hypothetical protein